MSQEYHVCISQLVSRVVEASDEVSYPIELNELLPLEEMKDILREVLRKEGLSEHGETFVTEGADGELLTIDLETMTITASVESSKELRKQVLADGFGESRGEARDWAKGELERLKEAAEQDLAGQEREIQQSLTAALRDSEAQRLERIHGFLQQVYGESLKRKAKQLGDITHMQESVNDDGNYELVIRVTQ